MKICVGNILVRLNYEGVDLFIEKHDGDVVYLGSSDEIPPEVQYMTVDVIGVCDNSLHLIVS